MSCLAMPVCAARSAYGTAASNSALYHHLRASLELARHNTPKLGSYVIVLVILGLSRLTTVTRDFVVRV